MIQHRLPKEQGHRDTSRASVIDRLARRVVLQRLSKLREGKITITDDFGRHTIGADSSDGLHAIVCVHDPRFYRQVLAGGGLGLAESYIQDHWRSDNLTALLQIFVRNIHLAHESQHGAAWFGQLLARSAHWLHRNTPGGSRRNISAHYDLGNDLFELFLDPTMTYSSGVFETPDATMTDASVAKLDRLCKKLHLGPDDHLLEIGTGWGSMAIHAARHYGCRVTTTTISKEQHTLATERIDKAGLSRQIEVLLTDYRELEGQYDKLVSIEMIEAVGHRFLDTYFAQCSRLLKPEGMMAIQAITMNAQRYKQYLRSVDFIQKYVFPGSCCPALGAMVGSIDRSTDFRVFQVEEIGPHYAETLRRWRERFFENVGQVRELGYTDAFIRLWDYYLCYCEAGFEERYIGDVQMVLTKPRCRIAPLLPSIGRTQEALA